jgi:hypothetical protein
MAKRQDLQTLRSLIAEADKLLSTTELPERRSQRAHELLTAAISLSDALIETPPAVILGANGGKVTAKRGPEYYAKIAAMRKTRAGGRPKKGE